MRGRIWLIEGPDEDCTVTRNGRLMTSGLPERLALVFVRKKMFRGDKVFRVESDGYRRTIPV